MILYWTMFLLPMMASISPYRLDRLSRAVVLTLLGAVLVVIIGLRDHVGHDWNNYLLMFYRADAQDFYAVLTSVEPRRPRRSSVAQATACSPSGSRLTVMRAKWCAWDWRTSDCGGERKGVVGGAPPCGKCPCT